MAVDLVDIGGTIGIILIVGIMGQGGLIGLEDLVVSGAAIITVVSAGLEIFMDPDIDVHTKFKFAQ